MGGGITKLLCPPHHHRPSPCSTLLPPCNSAAADATVETEELSWLASSLYNLGVDLHGRQQYAAAVSAMAAALAAVATGLLDGGEVGGWGRRHAAACVCLRRA